MTFEETDQPETVPTGMPGEDAPEGEPLGVPEAEPEGEGEPRHGEDHMPGIPTEGEPPASA